MSYKHQSGLQDAFKTAENIYIVFYALLLFAGGFFYNMSYVITSWVFFCVGGYFMLSHIWWTFKLYFKKIIKNIK
jgi:hypothetical protein